MRIALATAGTGGDVRPFAVLAAELAARGHEVTIISWPVHAEGLSLDGVRFVPAGPHRDAGVVAEAATPGARGRRGLNRLWDPAHRSIIGSNRLPAMEDR